jgi:glycosyltransferase involved in cell wall biosynthesis
MSPRRGLSVVLITRNEAARIRACLDSVRWADELVVVDADGTERVERFDSDLALQARQRELETEFRGDGWDGPHGRFN